jgi:hypothetical protein
MKATWIIPLLAGVPTVTPTILLEGADGRKPEREVVGLVANSAVVCVHDIQVGGDVLQLRLSLVQGRAAHG